MSDAITAQEEQNQLAGALQSGPNFQNGGQTAVPEGYTPIPFTDYQGYWGHTFWVFELTASLIVRTRLECSSQLIAEFLGRRIEIFKHRSTQRSLIKD